MRDAISANEEGRNLRTRRLRDWRKVAGKNFGDGSREEGEDDVLLVEPSPNRQKTAFAPVMWAAANTKKSLTCCGCNISGRVLEMMKTKSSL